MKKNIPGFSSRFCVGTDGAPAAWILSALLLGSMAWAQSGRPGGGGGTRDGSGGRLTEQGREVFAPAERRQAPGAVNEAATRWSVLIVAYPVEGDNDGPARETAMQALERVRRETGLEGAYVERRGRSVVVAYGRYDSPSDPRATRDLERIRRLEWNGVRPFEGAVLAPPAFDSLPGSIPEYDLRRVREAAGPRAVVYTLQVAVYARVDGRAPTERELREIRQAAERAAVTLRREGDQAFYYHLADRSVVTIGRFDEADFQVYATDQLGNARTIPPRMSPRLRAIRDRHPHLLVNGAGVRTRTPAAGRGRDQNPGVLQPSQVVEVPR